MQHSASLLQFWFLPEHSDGVLGGAVVGGAGGGVGAAVVGAKQVSSKVVHLEFMPRARHSPEQHSVWSTQSMFVPRPLHGEHGSVGGLVGGKVGGGGSVGGVVGGAVGGFVGGGGSVGGGVVAHCISIT